MEVGGRHPPPGMSSRYFDFFFFLAAFFFIEVFTSSRAWIHAGSRRRTPMPYFFFFLAAFFFATDEFTSFPVARAATPSVAHGLSTKVLRLVGSPGFIVGEIHVELRQRRDP